MTSRDLVVLDVSTAVIRRADAVSGPRPLNCLTPSATTRRLPESSTDVKPGRDHVKALRLAARVPRKEDLRVVAAQALSATSAPKTKPDEWQDKYFNADGSIRTAQINFWMSAGQE